MVYFPTNTNKKTPRLLPDLQKTEFLPSYYSCLQNIYNNNKKKARFHLPTKTLHYVGASMYWEHRSKVVTRWNLEYAKGQPKEVKPSGELTGET